MSSINRSIIQGRTRYRLVDVYNAMRTERNFNYAFWTEVTLTILFESFMSCFGNILVVAAVILIFSVSICGFFIWLPVIARPFSLWFWFNIVWGINLLVNVLFNYIMAAITDPGFTNECNSHSLTRAEEAERQCKKCNLPKPKRSHHCSLCNHCVMKMDHHCPWINNCVGHRNYRYFILFLFWTFIATFYLTVASIPITFQKNSILTILFEDAFFKASYKAKQFIHPVSAAFNLRGNTVPYISNANNTNLDLIPLETLSLSKKKEVDFFNFAKVVFRFVNMKSDIVDTNNTRSRRLWESHRSSSALSSSMSLLSPEAFADPNDPVAKRLSVISVEDIGILVVFTISSAVCLGVGSLLSFHFYLVTTGQTTIEFYTAMSISERLKRMKSTNVYINPYDQGTWKNLQQVFGSELPWYLSVMPSFREPPPIVPVDLSPDRLKLMSMYESLEGVSGL